MRRRTVTLLVVYTTSDRRAHTRIGFCRLTQRQQYIAVSSPAHTDIRSSSRRHGLSGERQSALRRHGTNRIVSRVHATSAACLAARWTGTSATGTALTRAAAEPTQSAMRRARSVWRRARGFDEVNVGTRAGDRGRTRALHAAIIYTACFSRGRRRTGCRHHRERLPTYEVRAREVARGSEAVSPW